MGSKNELQSMSKRCRICLCERGAVVTFNDKAVRDMFQDLSKCTSIDLKIQDNLPNSICHICLYKMNDWTEFKERFAQSNKILTEKINISEASDNTIQNFDEDRSAVDAKQKSLNQNNKESTSVTDKKNCKANVSSSESAENTLADIISISSENRVPFPNFVSEVKSNADRQIPNTRKRVKSVEENVKEKSNLMSVKTTLSPAKRAKSVLQNSWAAKRKLFLENKDTSILSDTSSEKKKSQTKENDAEEHLRKKRVEKVLKSLEVNLTQKYSKFPVHSDSDKSKRRINRRSCTPQLKQNWPNQSEETNNKTESRMRKLSSGNFSDLENTMDTAKEVELHKNDEAFEPISWNSQLIVNDTIFNVSSVLSLPGSPISPNKSNQSYDEKQENDTSIIDAIKLRRVNRTSDVTVKRCLELKVESAQLDVLRRVQIGVADFVEKELQHKQLRKISAVTLDEPSPFNSESRIDQKVKDLVEATVIKNVDTECRGISEHTKTVYQPRVMLERLDIAKESKTYNINNISALKRNMSERNFTESFNLYRKRQIVPPKRYSDYHTSLDSNSDQDNSAPEEKRKMTSLRSYSSVKIDQPQTRKHIATTNTTKNNTTTTNEDNTIRHTKERGADYEDAIRIQGAATENHICGLCGNSFNNRKDVETHVRSHRDVPSIVRFTADDIRGLGETATPQRKEKMMRCKRCKELVESRCVKKHSIICNERSIYKCSLCGRKFVTPEQLSQHFAVEHGRQCKVIIDRSKIMGSTTNVSATKRQETETVAKTPDQITKNDIQSHKITSTAVRLEDISCFLCDKVFTDEEVLKNHLQDHCDQVPSDDEQDKEPEQYQCGICSKFMKTEELLQEHVNQHLYDESSRSKLPSNNQKSENCAETKKTELYFGDNLTSSFSLKSTQKMQVDPKGDLIAKEKWSEENVCSAKYQCLVCDELFDADKLGEHISLHKASTNVCQLCDKPFRTEEELQEHVMTHM